MKDIFLIKQEIFKEFAKKWSLPVENVKYIYWLADSREVSPGKITRILRGFHINLSTRQVKYFIKKTRFMVRMGGNQPLNYSELMSKET